MHQINQQNAFSKHMRDQQLFEFAVAAILDTAKKAYFEGYSDGDCIHNFEGYPIDCEEREQSWQQSEAKAACDKMIAELKGG